jgi:uncharacterized protein (TIGR02099 family)
LLKHGFRVLKHGCFWLYRLVFWLVLVLGIAWALVIMVLAYFVLPNIEEYSDPILSSVSQAIGQTVEIGRIEGGWRNYRPALNFYDVQVHEAGGLQTLALDRVDTVLSWKSLIVGNMVFKLIEFSGSNIEFRRDSIGTFWVAGKAVERRQPGARPRLLRWLLAQEQIVVGGAQVTWIDEMRSAPELLVKDVKLRIENSGKRHRFGLTGKPPAELASAITLNADFYGSAFEGFAGQARVYAEFEYANLAYAQEWFPLPLDLDSGLGVLRLWMDVENRAVQRVIAEGNLVNVAGRLGPELDTFAMANLSGRVQWDDHAAAKTIAMSDLTFETVDGVRLAPATISLKTPRGAENRTVLRVRSLELAPLVDLSRFLPLNTATREKLAAWQPTGVIDEMRASWLQATDGAQALSLDGQFRQLSLNSVGKMPGFSGMSGSVIVSGGEGSVALKTENAVLDYPQFLPEPIPFDYLDADASWQLDAKNVRVTVDSLSFTNVHAAGKMNGSYFYPGQGRGEIDMRAVLVRGDARDVWRYFPHRTKKVRDWLKQGLVAGVSDDARLHFEGPLDEFPFEDRSQGIFEISAAVQDGTVRIAKDWPLIEGINGDLLISGDRIDIKPRTATIMGADVSESQVSIVNVGKKLDARLLVNGKAAAEVGQYLQFVANSPVAGYTRGASANMRGQGIGNLQLRLDLPFADRAATTVNGTLDMAGPVFSVSPRAPQLNDYALQLEFDRNNVAFRNGRARMLGGPVRFGSVPSRKGTRTLHIGGVAEARDAALFLDVPVLTRLEGRTEWRGNLSFGKGGSHLRVESSLVGVGSRMPAPLDKLEPVALPVRFDLWARGDGRNEYALSLDKIGSARLATVAGKLERGEIVFNGDAIALPKQSGIIIRGTCPLLDYDGWRRVLAELQPKGSPAAVALESLDLKVGALLFGGRTFKDLRITGKQIKDDWQIGLAGPQVKGSMLVASDADGGERINARFEYLKLAPDEPSISVPIPPEERTRRLRIPAGLNVIAEAFEFEGKALGRLELLAEPEEDGWQLQRLVLANPDGRMDIKGVWRITGRPHAEYTVRFEASDTGKFLARLGYAETVVGGTASLSGPVSWLGGPFHPDLPTLSGKLRLEVADGRFVQVDPGAAQLVGILSLQALPRRLTLNFKDVFSTGFSFDRIEADVAVSEGVARTDNFRMEGVSAEVTMQGEVDLVKETQDLTVRARPMLASAAAVAGAAVINPLVGVATLLVQKALGDPVEQAATREYRVTGSWGNPQVERIKRPPPEPATPRAVR